jgi:hypothetical protein
MVTILSKMDVLGSPTVNLKTDCEIVSNLWGRVLMMGVLSLLRHNNFVKFSHESQHFVHNKREQVINMMMTDPD